MKIDDKVLKIGGYICMGVSVLATVANSFISSAKNEQTCINQVNKRMDEFIKNPEEETDEKSE